MGIRQVLPMLCGEMAWVGGGGGRDGKPIPYGGIWGVRLKGGHLGPPLRDHGKMPVGGRGRRIRLHKPDFSV